jgi:formylglycine-generating enzyme required for sulfatase activity
MIAAGGEGRRPVIGVSWYDAKEYVAWLSRKTGKTYRLLSEAEWEYAARAGTTTSYAFGDTITKNQAQFSEGTWGSTGKTAEVGSFLANRFGLHDMHGNAYDWCEDAMHPNYQGAPDDGTAWPGGDTSYRIIRGGAWAVPRIYLGSVVRGQEPPDRRSDTVGFRVAREL